MKTIILLLLTVAICNSLWAVTDAATTLKTKPIRPIQDTLMVSGNFKTELDKMTVFPDVDILSALPVITPAWNEPGPGIGGGVKTIVVQGNDIYVGGWFVNGAGIPDADYLARWDGCEWHAVVPGIDGCVNAIVFNGSTMYLGGCFSGHVAKWSGNVWDVLEGLNGDVLGLTVNANGVFAGGYFTNASGQANADGIARWNGTAWNSMGTGIELNGNFLDMTSIGNDVYVGGEFINAGGVPEADHIARWNGTSWQSLGAGLNSTVTTLRVSGTDLYAGGDFYDAGGNQDADNIAKWNGSNWINVGPSDGQYSLVTSIYVGQSYIYTCRVSYGGIVYMLRYDFQNNIWEEYPDVNAYGDPINSIVELGTDLFASWGDAGGFGGVLRWGEPGPYIEITGVPFSLCQDAAPISLPTTQSGYTGTWSGPGVSNNTFNPAGQYGYVLLTFTPNPGQCVSPVTVEIDVFLHQLEYDFSPTFCESEPPVSLAQFQYGVLGTWSGTGVSNNFFDPSGLLGGYWLTFTPNAGQCYAVAMLYVMVELSVIPNISGVPQSICENGSAIALPVIQSGIEGNWSGQGVINNIFDPSGLNGPITLTFTPTPEFCATANTINIQVNLEIVITINGIPDTLCQLSPPISLPTTQTGIPGNWSGPGVTNNSFFPANQIGNVILTFSPLANQCAAPVTSSIWVFINIPVVTGIPVSVCESNPPIALPTNLNEIEGNWSGQGVTNNTFNPTGLFGNITLTFTPLQAECASMAIQAILVDSLFLPVITGLPFSICSLADPIPLPEILSGIAGNWSGPGVSNNVFDPTDLSGDILLNFIPNAGQCASTASAFITVQNAIIPEITGVPTWMCVLAPPIALPVIQQGISGVWSGQGITNNAFNPKGLNGDIPITFTPFAGQCANNTVTIITVYTSFIPEITGVPSSICEIGLPQNLPTVQNGVTGNWSGPGVTNNIFNPSGQSDTVELIFTPLPLQCATNTSWNLVIDTPSIPQIIDVPTTLCESDLPVALSLVQSGIMGEWSGPGITNDTINPAGLNGILVLTFSPNPGQCGLPATTDLLVNVNVHPVLADLPDSLCQNDHAIELGAVQDSIPGMWVGTGIENNIFKPDSLSGIYTLSFIANNGACEDTATTRIFINTLPSITHLHITCDSVHNTFEVSFDIIGGDSTSYTIDDVLLDTIGFTSAPIPFTQTNYSFALDDAVGCGPVTISGFNTCLCSTNAGTINVLGSPLRICLGPKFIVTNNGDAHLYPDDVLSYILHDQPGTSLGHVYSINEQGVFSFIPGMIPGQTYFISVVAGTNNGFGAINLQDPCLSVSPGVPVIFEVCDPQEDNNDPVLPDDNDPFTQPGEGETPGKPTETTPKGSIINMINPDLSNKEDADKKVVHILLDKPESIIALNVYDMGGRMLVSRRNIQAYELDSIWENLRKGNKWASGFYLVVLEIQGNNGKKVVVHKGVVKTE